MCVMDDVMRVEAVVTVFAGVVTAITLDCSASSFECLSFWRLLISYLSFICSHTCMFPTYLMVFSAPTTMQVDR